MSLQHDLIEIIIQHGKNKGLQKQAKVFKKKIEKQIKAIQQKLKEAEKEQLSAGHFDDCGSFYDKQVALFEGQLEATLEQQEKTLQKMVQIIKQEAKNLKEMKHDFKENHGENEFLKLENAIQFTGLKKHNKHMQSLRKKKSNKKP